MQLTLGSGSRPIGSPEWSDIEAAIRNLDGNLHTEVGLYENQDCYLQVGGVGDCLVCSVRQGETLYILTDPKKSASSMKWVVAGQGADYPENECFCPNDVLKVAQVFWASKSRSTEFEWQSF